MSALDQVKNFFGFIKMPFSKGLSVNELFKTSSMTEALTRLDIGLENEEIGLITGESGCGKSNILRAFTNGIDLQTYKHVYIKGGNFKITEIAKRVLSALDIPIPFQGTQALRKLKNTIIQFNSSKNLKTLIIIDEAQELPLETMIQLKEFLNYQYDNANLTFLILCGHKNLGETLKSYPLESLNRRIRIRYEIKPLSCDETKSYIQHHLKISGLQKNIFSDDAIDCIYQLSRGLLSDINRFGFESIIYCAAKSKEIVDKSIVELFQQK